MKPKLFIGPNNKFLRSRVTRQSERGFSLIEILITCVVLMIMAVVAVFNMAPVLRDAKLTNSTQTVLSTMTLARERALSTRRVYQVTFTAPGTMTITQAATGIVTETYTLDTTVQFDAETGIPNTTATTPDGLGSGPATGAIDFDVGVGLGGTNSVYFYPDGSARDAAGNINNGVVYLARPGELMSSRAVSLFGLSGRIRGWRLYKKSGSNTKYWSQQ